MRLHINPPAINFNPRSDERSDITADNFLSAIDRFQSTLRRTERLQCLNAFLCSARFQSTLRRTERHGPLATPAVTDISIHAPTNGATLLGILRLHKLAYFNPRSDERSDFLHRRTCSNFSHFNPRSDERSDYNNSFFSCSSDNFNPRSDERSDQDGIITKITHIISIHAPTNGATQTAGAAVSTIFLFQSTLRRTERQALASRQCL